MYFMISIGLSALYMIWLISIMKTENIKSAMVFKFTPIILAISLVVSLGIQIGWINIPGLNPITASSTIQP